MTLTDVLKATRAADIHLEARGDRLHVEAPTGAVTPDLRLALAEHKQTLLAVVWRLDAMQRLAIEAPRPLAYARADAKGGPGHCFSCGDAHPHPGAYGRCAPCDIASDVYHALRNAQDSIEFRAPEVS
jgi:hypothetical protein